MSIESKIEEQIQKYEKELDTFITNKIGVVYEKDDIATKALNMSYDELKSLNSEDCCLFAYKLLEYSCYIQSIYNRLNSIQKWCDQYLEIIIGKYAQDYTKDIYIKYEEKRARIINDNSVAEALIKILLKTSGKIIELNQLSQRINNMSSVLLELSKIKRGSNNEHRPE